ncbi:MAG: hypothetical protein K8M05_08305 [Deltaproteobacteria bacterium]|nr:hypothetical protein [Kofleriaceae bacterium]
MKPHATLAAITVTLTSMAPIALAHPDGHDGTPAPLHVDDSYDECFFDLHPELTQAEFDEFAREGGVVMHDLQLASAEAMRPGDFEVSLDFSRTVIDDSKGAWNNTMSHPTSDHWLGHTRAFPRLSARAGVSRRVGVGVWGTLDPRANYGFLGMHSKVTVVEQDDATPVSVAVRPTAVALLGPEELLVLDLGIDASVSRSYKGLSPYVGLAAHTTAAFERSNDVDLDPGTAWTTAAFAGLAYAWRGVRVAAHGEAGPLNVLAARVGGAF